MLDVTSHDWHLQPPASFPIDFARWKTAVKVTNGDRGSAGWCSRCNYKPVVRCLDYGDMTMGILQWPQLQGPVKKSPCSTCRHFEQSLSKLSLEKVYL